MMVIPDDERSGNNSVQIINDKEAMPTALVRLQKVRKYAQYCREFHDQFCSALSGTNSEKRSVPSRTGGERILEMLWSLQMP